MKEIAKVIEVFKDKRAIQIELERPASCSSCQAHSNCPSGGAKIILEDVYEQVDKGDKLVVELEEKNAFLASVLVFFIPSLSFLASAYVLRSLPVFKEVIYILLIQVIYFAVLKYSLKFFKKRFSLKIVGKL